MKKINIKTYILTTLIVALTASCSEEFIDVSPEGKPLESAYYKTEDEAKAGLYAVYDVLRKNSGGFENMITMMNAGSDDHFAGGGNASDGVGIHSFANFTQSSTTIPKSFWDDHYQGIFRANVLISKLPGVAMSDSQKNAFAAESKALRALYYFNLVRMFRNVPLIIEPLSADKIYTVKQANPTDVYTQIENDLLSAISVLPSSYSNEEKGRFTKGAAQALLGKVYLYDGKNGLAVEQLSQVNGTPGSVNQYGNSLLLNYNDLWVVSNKFNSESLLEAAHSSVGSSHWGIWGQGSDEGNSVNVMVGLRGYVKIAASAPELPSGWSFNVITQDLYNVMTGDPRFGATIFDAKAKKAAGEINYAAGDQDTGYFLNKFLPRQSDVSTGTGDAVLNYRQNTYIIRLADTYLLEAEALGGTGTRAQQLLDAVRARVGLASVPVSLSAIKLERRKELAGEGHRFFDLVRWGDATSVLASRGFVAGKSEVFPIPYKELENTLIVQNPGY